MILKGFFQGVLVGLIIGTTGNSVLLFSSIGFREAVISTSDLFIAPQIPQNGTYFCRVGPYPRNFVGDVVLGIVYWSIPAYMEGKVIRISTDTKSHSDMTVEIWTGFIKPDEDKWWVTNAPKVAGSTHMANPSLTWMACEGNYTLVFAHWPFSCGCNEWEINITYKIEVYDAVLSSRAKEMFSFVSVSLRVLDIEGRPITGAQVKCYSEDWFIRYPDTLAGEYGFAITNGTGWVDFRIPVGNWTFFASAGEIYEAEKPGLGYFVILQNVRVTESTSIMLKPDDIIDLTVADVNGSPLDGRVSVMASDYVPIMEVTRSGATLGGHISIHVSRGFSYDILFLKEPSDNKVGYILHGKIGQARAVSIRPSLEKLCQLTFRLHDNHYGPASGTLHLFYHNFSINGWTVCWGIKDLDTILLTPGKIWATVNILKDGWAFGFYGGEHILSAGSVKTLRFGGPLTPKLWVSIYDWNMRETGSPQMWLQVTDSFGNLLEGFWDPRGERDIPVDLVQNGRVIFSENLGNRRVHAETGATPWMQIRIEPTYTKENSPEYKLRLNMGPFGLFELTGTLLSNETLIPYESIVTEHFILRSPAIFHDKFMKASSWLENAYNVLSGLLNESIKEKIIVDFHICWGFFASPNHIWFNFADIVWDNYSPNDVAAGSQVARAGGLLHELAHVFQGSDSSIKRGCNYYDPGWFGEPFASMLAGEAVWSLLGEKAGMLAFGERNRISFNFILKPRAVGDFQHIPYSYLRKHYGIGIHRDMIRLWAGVDEKHAKNRLVQAGFLENEIIIILYSYLSKQNLFWLFEPAFPDISEDRISLGLTLLSDSSPPSISIPSQHPPRDSVNPYQKVTIMVNVTDAESGVKNVTLFYNVDDGIIWIAVPMTYNESTRVYEGEIDGQPAGSTVKYKIVAFDHAENSATLDGIEPYCAYQVIPEYPSTTIILTLSTILIATTLTILWRRKNHKCLKELVRNI